MRYEIFLSVGMIFCALSFMYWKLYYKRLTSSLKDRKVRNFKISPLLMTTFLALLSLSVISVDSLIYAVTLENRLVQIEDEYDDIEFHNDFIKEVYTQYNIYFAGYYYQGDILILCLTEDAPPELIQRSSSFNQEVKIVEHNYNELLAIYRLVGNDRANVSNGDSMTIYIDIKENIVVVGTSKVDTYSEIYTVYISEGLLKIVKTNEGSYA